MAYDIPPPDQRPDPGYYYHFKHDPAGPLNNYAYYIYGVGHHTEDGCRTSSDTAIRSSLSTISACCSRLARRSPPTFGPIFPSSSPWLNTGT